MTVALLALPSICKFFLDDFTENESSSEDEISIISAGVIRKKIKVKQPRILGYITNVVSNYSSVAFQQNFLISIEVYETLVAMIGPRMKRSGDVGRQQIDLDKQILSVIWLLATPDSYRSVGERFDMGKSSLSICFMRVVKLLNEIAPRIITWPTGDQMQQVKHGFYNLAQVENVIGAVDGTFIPIKAPKEDPYSYVTRKCNYAITLQGICDAQLNFTDVFVGYPGRVSDNRIFRNSTIYFRIQNNQRQYFPNNEFIVGDKAYPLLPWCIPPYIQRGNLTRAQRFFNTKLSQTRQTIERTFALLFGRFRRLKYLDMNRTDCIPATVLAACVLHNLCLAHNDARVEDYIQEGIDFVIHNDDEERGVYLMQEGRQRRDEICRTMFQQYNL